MQDGAALVNREDAAAGSPIGAVAAAESPSGRRRSHRLEPASPQSVVMRSPEGFWVCNGQRGTRAILGVCESPGAEHIGFACGLADELSGLAGLEAGG